MLISSLLLAISTSVDSLGIGITYGIKNTKITILAKAVLFITAFTIAVISVWFGNTIKYIFPEVVTRYLGSLILVLMGIFMCFQSLKKSENNNKENKNIKKKPIEDKSKKNNTEEKIYSFFIKFLGITIKIIKNPSSSDLDKSNTIDYKEALFLGFALSLDSFCVGIGFSLIGISSLLFPFLVSVFQLIFLSFGNFIGTKINKFTKIPDNIWSIISGTILIIIGIIKCM